MAFRPRPEDLFPKDDREPSDGEIAEVLKATRADETNEEIEELLRRYGKA